MIKILHSKKFIFQSSNFKVETLFFFVFFALFRFSLISQPFGNEWITYSQKYLEIKITDTGIYRINYTVLSQGLNNIGENISNIDPRKIQIWTRGEEQYIYIEGENDGSFNTNDFIEFFAVKNDGWFDSFIYETPAAQSNPYYSLFNDTATYYLTISSENGKRMSVSNSVNFSNFIPQQYFFKEEIVSFTSVYYQGEFNSNSAYHPFYREGEGWFSNEINSQQTLSHTFNNLFAFTSNPALTADLKIIYAGENSNPHNIQISYNSNSFTENFTGFSLKKHDTILPANSIPQTIIYKSATPSGSAPDRTAVSHIYLKYPRTFNFSNLSKTIMIFPPSNDTAYINFNFNSTVNFFYDLTSRARIKDSISGTNHKALIPPANTERKIFATNQIQNISVLIPATNNNGKFNDFSSVPDSAFLIITHKTLWNEAQQYAAYRGNSVVADIDELYDQFAFGINKHPLAIRNFCNFLLNKIPQHLFILGKGISDAAFSTRNNAVLFQQNLIPTYGWPASDVAFTAGLNGFNRTVPAIPTGRLAAKNGQVVMDYLQKVKQFETNLFAENSIQAEIIQTIPNRIWMKHAIHFCGGKSGWENETFCNYVRQYEDLFEKDFYGGFVTTVSKNTTSATQNFADSIINLINKGISVITFFGHSSASVPEINIGFAKEYNNEGKYPLIIANGCLSGDIFTVGSESTSEDFVLEKEKGAIAYLAHTGLGYPTQLDNYTKNLYEEFSKQSYHQSIGKNIQQGISGMLQTDTSFIGTATMLGMTFHGDPSLKINSHEKPDYAIAQPYIFFTPEEVTTADDSFQINIVVFNLGKAITDSVSILVRRTFPDGSFSTHNKIFPPVFYKDTFTLKLPVNAVSGAGLNQFFIMVDDNNLISELAELNNVIGGNNSVELTIKSGELIPIYPYNFAVVPNRKIVLSASTSEFFVSEKEYIFQIDTTDLYNSSSLRQYTITSSGGIVKWNIDTNYFKQFSDSVVFFWRTSPNTPNDFKWREHSFQIISGKEGWGQKHFFQLKNNLFENILYKKTEREIQFQQKSATLQCNIQGNPQSISQYEKCEYKIDFSVQDNGSATLNWPAMYIAIIDKCTLKPWGTRRCFNMSECVNPDNNFGNCNDQYGPYGRKWIVENYFVFLIANQVQMDSLASLLNNKIPDGNYILAYCFGNPLFNSNYWNASHKLAFQNLGATQMTNDTVPYILIAQKGNPAFAKEKVGAFSSEYISLDAIMNSCAGEGIFTTPLIGPAKKWGALYWNFDSLTSGNLNIGILNASNNVSLKNFSTFSGNIFQLNDSINAALYSNIKLQANLKDSTSNTPPPFNYWYVLYDEIPEAALDNPFSFYANSLQQGDNLKFNIAIENVSNSDMDSLRIKYWIVNGNAVSSVIYKKKKPLPAGEILYDTVSFSTKNISGNCRFWIEVNPKDSLWQLEKYHFNNIASLAFEVTRDNINPLLDVSFDGVRILNGDIVSPTPEIVIQLKDENKFLAMDDTSNFKIFITDPEQKTERIYFTKNGAEQMNFKKANLPENKCKIEWKPKFSTDGIYQLRVQGSDASGNNAGDLDYSINFEVISKSTITEVLNYPNPFSSSTRFVFTLTGSEIPDYFKIQILTVSGKVIREITREELGNIRIGRNITEYAWNGTDEFGDPLANGVYLYRVIAKINGEEIEHRQTNADTFFKKGFGKMYLMR